MRKAELDHEDTERPEDERADGDAPDAELGDEPVEEPADGDPEVEAADTVEEEIGSLRAEIEELNDRHLRLAAEFNNYRRRSEQARVESWSRAQADLLTRFLDVLDDLQRVAELDLSSVTVEGIMEGIDLVERKFTRVLEDAGVEVIDPQGEPFDPERMEAMMRVPAESEEEEDVVAQVFAKGYVLDGILVRPARVSVRMRG